jgi:hypothetical protein
MPFLLEPVFHRLVAFIIIVVVVVVGIILVTAIVKIRILATAARSMLATITAAAASTVTTTDTGSDVSLSRRAADTSDEIQRFWSVTAEVRIRESFLVTVIVAETSCGELVKVELPDEALVLRMAEVSRQDVSREPIDVTDDDCSTGCVPTSNRRVTIADHTECY